MVAAGGMGKPAFAVGAVGDAGTLLLARGLSFAFLRSDHGTCEDHVDYGWENDNGITL